MTGEAIESAALPATGVALQARGPEPNRRLPLALVASAALAVALCGYSLWALWPAVTFRADLLMWSESDFVGSVIKLERGLSIYTPPEDSNSLIYTPGAALLTYAVTRLAGQPPTVLVLRLVQLLFVTLAAALATGCVRRLERLIGPEPPPVPVWGWRILTFALLWLACTAPAVNAWVLALHTDAASLLVSMLGFWATLCYLERPSRARLLVLAAFPGLAFLFKQFLVSWAAVLTLLLLLREPRRVKRWAGFALLSAVGIGATTLLCYSLWGDNFLFWTFRVMGGPRSRISLVGEHGISLLRGADHLLRAWSEISLGVVGGAIALRGANFLRLAPLWVAWVALVACQALSSGAGWNVLYHFGPGAVIGLCWLLAALPGFWHEFPALENLSDRLRGAWRGSLFVAGVLAIVLALRVVPSRDPHAARFFPPRGEPADFERYLREIEGAAAGHPLDRVLLDVGNWIYLPERILMRDRAVSLADQPYAGTYENFKGLLERLRSHHYALVLVRNLHQPNFLYDWHDWKRSSGVRAALLHDYEEIRVIPPVAQEGRAWAQRELSGPVSVLVPRKTGS